MKLGPEVRQTVTHLYCNNAFWKTTLWCRWASRQQNPETMEVRPFPCTCLWHTLRVWHVVCGLSSFCNWPGTSSNKWKQICRNLHQYAACNETKKNHVYCDAGPQMASCASTSKGTLIVRPTVGGLCWLPVLCPVTQWLLLRWGRCQELAKSRNFLNMHLRTGWEPNFNLLVSSSADINAIDISSSDQRSGHQWWTSAPQPYQAQHAAQA